MDFLLHLFDTRGFPPRWHCGTWTAEHGWLHILSDIGIWGAYFTIPCILGYFIVQRKDLPFRRVFLLFGLFILACGTTHLMEAAIFWWPAYRLAGMIKLLTAAVSWLTVIALVPAVPRVLAMRSPAELEREIAARKLAEEQMQHTNLDLERRVAERTAELTAANESLRRADRSKDEFLAVLSHELRNPLSPIRTGLEILRVSQHDPEQIHETLSIMQQQTGQLIALIDDLMDVSRISKGRLKLKMQSVPLAEVVRNAVEAAKPKIDDAGHNLTVDLPAEAMHIHADPTRLAQVLSNLLTNAAKYTPEGGDIRLTASRQPDQLCISVTDNGIGIPDDQKSRIFDMFAQIEHPLKQANVGLGIGLALARSLIEMHGGRLEVHSDGLNQGSEFQVLLPLSQIQPEQTSPPAASNATRTEAEPRRVLVVDDNEQGARLLAAVIELQGHEVRQAHDGLEALAVAAEFRPDVIILDLGMPKMDGYEAARQIRQQEWGKHVLLIALTGWGHQEHREKTTLAGFDHHVVKPANPAELQRLLAESVERN